MEPEEREAIVRAQRGDRRAFEVLVRRHQRRAYLTALGLCGSAADAWDLSQEAFIRAYRALARFDTAQEFYPWFHRILVNACSSFLRWRGRRREEPLEGQDGPAPLEADPQRFDPRVLAERSEGQELVWRALGRLSPAHREVLVLKDLQGLRYEEIARLLGCPPGTIMSRLYHARRHLRDALRRLGAEGSDAV